MVRRTGVPDTPDIITPAQRVAAPVADMSGAWEAVANFTDEINKAVQPALARRGAELAGRAAKRGDYRPRTLELNAIDAAYNAGIESAYLAKTGMEVESLITRTAAEHPDGEPPDGLVSRLQDAKTAYLETVRPEYAVAVGNKFDQLASRAAMQADATYRDVQTKSAFETLKLRATQLEDQLTSVTTIEGALEAQDGDPEKSPLGEYTAVLDQMASNPAFAKFGFTTADAADKYARLTSRIVANGYAEAAVTMATDGDFSPQAVHNAYTMLDEALKDPDLVLNEGARDSTFGNARQVIQREVQYRRQLAMETRRALADARREVKFELKDTLDNYKAAVTLGGVLGDEQLSELASAVEQYGGVVERRAFRDLTIQVGVQRQFQGLTLPQMRTAATAFTSREHLDPDAALAAMAARNFVDRVERAANTDPIQTYQALSGKPAPAVITKEGGFSAEGLKARVAFAQEAQTFLQREKFTMFSPAEAQALSIVADSGGPELLAVGKAIVDAVGADNAFAAVRDLGQKEAYGLAAAGAAYASGQPNFAADIAKGQALLRNPAHKKADFKEDERATILENAIGKHARVLTPTTQLRIRKAADAAFEAQMASNPTANPREVYKDVVRRATGARRRDGNAVYGGLGDYRGKPVEVPAWVRQSKFRDVVNLLRAEDFQKGSVSGAVPMAGGRALSPQQLKTAFMRSTPDGMYMFYATDPDGDDPQYVADATGKPYKLDLNRVRDVLKKRAPQDVE